MAARRPALAAAVLLVAAVGCVTPGPAGAPAASGDPGSQPFFLPGQVTPVPEGVVGTEDPFYAAHPATSQFVLPSATASNPAPIKADYVVAAIDPYPGPGGAAAWRISCLARGKALNGNVLEFRFELLVDRPPPAPATWPVVRTPELQLGKARVTHYFGAGSGYEGYAGSVAIARVARGADAVAFDFGVDARMEPTSAGPGTPKATPTPIRGQETPGAGGTPPPQPATAAPAPTAVAPTATAPAPTAQPSPSPGQPASTAPHRVLTQFEETKTVRWTGTFYVKPETLP